jgi:menaquinone-dependent protoporphyrinogen IX oxidase
MEPIVILYATHKGQTQRIAEHIAASVRAHGLLADVVNAHIPEGFSPAAYSADSRRIGSRRASRERDR